MFNKTYAHRLERKVKVIGPYSLIENNDQINVHFTEQYILNIYIDVKSIMMSPRIYKYKRRCTNTLFSSFFYY